MTLNEESIKLFNDETKNLESQLQLVSNKDSFSIPEIVQIYYLAMNVDSLVIMMTEKFEEDSSVMEKVKNVKSLISDFNSSTHKKILKFLSYSVDEITKELSSTNTQNKTKEQIELEAKKFETLRETMSTKEFVEQYDRGVS